MQSTAIMLYNFTPQEVGTLRLLLRKFPLIRILPVEKASYGMRIGDVLAGKAPPALCVGRELQRKMLLLANAEGQMFHFLLAACSQMTEEKVLRAVLTETNKNWTGIELYENLLEEETQLESMQ